MKSIAGLFVLGLITAACVDHTPLDNRKCPCGGGLVCCTKTDICLPPEAACTCPAGTHDGGNGACVVNGTCSAGYHDGGNGTCVATGTCISGYRDGGSGTCVPTSSCSTGYHDGGNGTCVATGTCSDGYRDGGNGTCVATGTCSNGYHDGGDGKCLPAGQCITGMHDDGTGLCVTSGCATGYYVDPVSEDHKCTALVNGIWRTIRIDMWPVFAACSDDGARIATAAYDGLAFSSDSGATWTTPAWFPSGRSSGVTLSGDGRHIAATRADRQAPCVGETQLAISNDSGGTWTEVADHHDWNRIGATHDGAKLVATVCPVSDQIRVSTDYGATWTQRSMASEAGLLPIFSVTGSWLAALGTSLNKDIILVSADWGATWVERKAPVAITHGMAFIGPQERLLAYGDNAVYSSLDGGATWEMEPQSPCASPPMAALDGLTMVCNDAESNLHLSRDGGGTWTKRGTNSSAKVDLLTISGDGKKLLGHWLYGAQGDLLITELGE